MRSTCAYLRLAVLVLCAASTGAFAQTSTPAPAGPVPPAIIHAKSIFVSNAGANCDLFPGVFIEGSELPHLFTGDQDRPYTEFYAALKANGDYTLATDPSQADLVLELRLWSQQVPLNNGPLNTLPMFRLVIYDSKSHYALWTITQSIEPAVLQKNQDRNLDQALSGVLSKFLYIAGKTTAPAH
ncbi:MAG: hypothetical protein ABSD61_05100 [Terracidiphilus sp.]